MRACVGFLSGRTFLFVAAVCFSSSARATVGPPVKVVVPPDKLQPAASGEPYDGAIEIRVGADGQLADFQLSGEGWEVELADAGTAVDVRSGTSIVLKFHGTPADASRPLFFSATFDGRLIRKRIDLGSDFFVQSGRPTPVASVDAQGRLSNFRAEVNRAPFSVAGGQVIRFRGKIAYLRPQTMGGSQTLEVGVDNIWYEIIDEDDISTEVIYAGLTEQDGTFDVTVNWDDCDIGGCDDPDIYLRWETDNGVLAVQRSDILEEDYSWSTADDTIDDFEGSDVNFGTVMPANLDEHVALHIHTSITRAFRYIQLKSGVALTRVEVQWPESDNATYYSSFWEEIHIAPSEQWNEGTIVHEYGHHLLEVESFNVSPDYCNNFCDGPVACTPGDDCDKEGHCLWCPETDHDAWNEGFPDWLASVVTRDFPATYGVAALSAGDNRWGLESLGTCCQDNMTYSALITEGFIAALLRDIDDGQQDDHSGGAYDCTGVITPLDCIADATVLGPEEIFAVALQDDATTPLQFIQKFRARYPQYDQDLWSTVNNVSPNYTFPVPTPQVKSQTLTCKVNMAGDPMTIEAIGNGSMLRYQWERFNLDVVDGAGISGANCPELLFDPLSPAHAGIYRAEVSTCDQSSSVMSLPIRVSVLPARGDGEGGISWGRNGGGQLGRGVLDVTGEDPGSAVPAPMIALSDAVSISQGADSWHKLAVRFNGEVWGWGYNDNGQLGKNPAELFTSHTPIKVQGLENIVQAASGNAYSMALRADGKVYVWGDNDYGTRGEGSFYGYNPAIHQVANLDCVISITAGSYHAAVVKSDGTVWTWGNNYYGQLGFPHNGALYLSQPTPTEVPGINDAVAVAAGSNHTLVLRQNGTVLAFGRNDSGELGDGTFQSRSTPMPVAGLTEVSAVRGGYFSSFAILNDGTVRGWGYNSGQLGNGLLDRSTTPVQPLDVGPILDVAGGWYQTIYLRSDRTVWITGGNAYGELGPRPYPEPLRPLPVAGLNDVIAIGAGAGTSFAVSAGVGPYIWQQPENKSVIPGQTVTFSIQHFGTPGFTYLWSRNGTPLSNGNGISGATTTTLTLEPAIASMGGNYYVGVYNPFGFAVSQPATLTFVCANGDGDCDGAIDGGDATTFALCLAGPGAARPAVCEIAAFGNFDANNDNDVDLRDGAVLQNCFSGEGFINPACAP